MREAIQVLRGAFIYEFLMQIRRKSLWITFAFFILVMGGFAFGYQTGGWPSLLGFPLSLPLIKVIGQWTIIIGYSFPLGIGLLLADRLVRDTRLHVDELLVTTPGHSFSRLMGKYLGSTLATIIPAFLFHCVGIGCILYHSLNLQTLPLALFTFITIVLPGMLFVGACSIALPTIVRVPLYQIVFTGYWFWGNLLPSDTAIPTLSGTILTPSGAAVYSGFLGGRSTVDHASVIEGIASIIVLLALSILAMAFAWYVVKRRHEKA